MIDRNDMKNLKSEEEIINTKIENNNIFHNACIIGDKKRILEILNNYPHLYKLSNIDGNNCILLLIKSGFYDIAKDIINKNRDILKLLDNSGNTIIQNTINKDFLDYLIDICPLEILNNININGTETPLVYLFLLLKKDREYLKLIKKLISKGINLNIPLEYLPLCNAIDNNDEELFNLLINEKNIDLNLFDNYNRTPLICAIERNNEKFIIKLVEKGANINLIDNYRERLPINVIIKNRNPKLFELFMKFNPDLTIIDNKMNTPLHYLIYSNNKYKWINNNSLLKILNKENLNVKNLKGLTVKDLINSYNKKNNNIKKVNKEKNKEEDKLEKEKKKEIKEMKDMKDMKEEMNEEIKIDKKGNLVLPKTIKINYGLFNADSVHSFIYMYYLINKYKSLFMPFQFSLDIKKENELYEMRLYNEYKSEYGETIMDYLVNIYSKYFYELLPYIIIWRNKEIYYINKDLELYVKKILSNKRIKFIMLKITLLVSSNVSHANILIYDIKNNNVYRFDPYGEFNSNDVDILDNKLEEIFMRVNKGIKYYSPKKYMGDYKYQLMSGDLYYKNRNLGDPGGYCLAWTIFFVELIIKNNKKDIKDIIKDSFREILNYNENLLSFIRNYAFYLNKEKDKIMKKINIDYINIYKNNYKEDKLNKIFGYINNYLYSIYSFWTK